ncbi:terpene synthase family protein [Chitinophaga arvensicola]|uniref:Terpene synthase n=1 Tax=Chitinophaga arvensicola TaxID=29529 RepID=A0A1I0RQ94_9BACT|nr:hypothetical protein [Chitinophaga arvensicola]SEW43402.1 Terpene synthase family, metal binding domain [Chitinophaga arvensicola]
MEANTLQIPSLEFPTPSAISPLADDVQAHSFKWAHEFRLESPEKLKRFNKGKFGWYAAREYPAASYEELCLVGDLITWLFTIDDKCDRFSSGGIEAGWLQDMLNGFISIMEDGQSSVDTPLNEALVNINQRFSRISSTYLYSLYAREMVSYFEECLWETEMQKGNYSPSIGEYLQWRPKTGFYIMFPLVSIFGKIHLPEEVYENELVKKIELMLNLTANLANDLHSLERERALKTKGLNLVLIYEQELNIPLEGAIQQISEEYHRNLQTLEEYRGSLPFWSREINAQLDLYIDGLYIAIKAYFDWALIDTERYKSKA